MSTAEQKPASPAKNNSRCDTFFIGVPRRPGQTGFLGVLSECPSYQIMPETAQSFSLFLTEVV